MKHDLEGGGEAGLVAAVGHRMGDGLIATILLVLLWANVSA